MRLWSPVAAVAGALLYLAANATPAPSPWEQSASSLADQVVAILGPGQAHLSIRNLSTIAPDEIPAIRKLLEKDLKERGVLASGAESANSIRVTLSENQHERLWVAEIIEGNETRVAMVEIQHSQNLPAASAATLLLRKERLLGPDVLDSLPCSASERNAAVLGVAERGDGLLVLKQSCLLALDRTPSASFRRKTFENLPSGQALTRDPHGLIVIDAAGDGFLVSLPGAECAGSYTVSSEPNRSPGEGWSLQCHRSDDPWPILTADTPTGPATIKAFYNAARNYFTGVVTPNVGVDLPPFYSAALLPRNVGATLVIAGIDGKVQSADNGVLKPVAGTRDWGSDFAALHSGCGAGTQIVASGSGEALSDSLRAYELPAQEAIPASAPLTMEGTVTALWPAFDGKSLYVVVRNAKDQYEVDRVTALCN